jgi:hypothetical protein
MLAGKLPTAMNTTAGTSPKTESTGKAQQAASPAITPQVFTLTILGLGVFADSFGCYFLNRTARIELESAARFTGLVYALCIAGSDFAQFEKAANSSYPRRVNSRTQKYSRPTISNCWRIQ